MKADLAAKVLELDPVAFWFLIALIAAAAVAGFYFAFRFLRRARIIRDTPTSKIRSAAQGYLELEGRGELMEGEPIVAPLTGQTCTWYRYKVEKREVRYSNGKQWHTASFLTGCQGNHVSIALGNEPIAFRTAA